MDNIKVSYLFYPIVFLLSTDLISAEKDNRPNILFILSDDHAKSAISAYGGINAEIAPTPNIDKIAGDGAIFRNMICTNAISGPSRASLITGKYSTVNGFYQNEGGIVFDNTQQQLQTLLKDSGYTTSLFGKWHLNSLPVGFDHYMIHDKSQQGVYWNPIFNTNGKTAREKGYATTLTADAALDWMEHIRDKGKPFCMMLNFKAPHGPWEADSCYLHLYENIEFPYPDTFFDDYSGREETLGKSMATIFAHLSRGDLKQNAPDSLTKAEKKRWFAYGRKEGEIWSPSPDLTGDALKKWKFQKYIKDYFRVVRSVDDQVGRVIDYLKSNGLYDNTVIIYMGDQGFFLGEHGIYDKRWMYEEAIQMPFLICFPKEIKKGIKIDKITLNIDIAPTILDYAGVGIPDDIQGKSLRRLLSNNGRLSNWRKCAYYQYFEYPKWHNVQPHYGIRTERYKLIHFYYDIDKWELYDLKRDPHEMNNLISDTSYKRIVEKLKNEISRLQIEYKDNISLEERRKLTSKYSVGY